MQKKKNYMEFDIEIKWKKHTPRHTHSCLFKRQLQQQGKFNLFIICDNWHSRQERNEWMSENREWTGGGDRAYAGLCSTQMTLLCQY